MKQLMIFFFLLTWNAFASCPDLSGHYPVCRSVLGIDMLSEASDMTITQEDTTFELNYSLNSRDTTRRWKEGIFAHGKIRSMFLPRGVDLSMKEIAFCKNNRLTRIKIFSSSSSMMTYEKRGKSLVVSTYNTLGPDTQSICE